MLKTLPQLLLSLTFFYFLILFFRESIVLLSNFRTANFDWFTRFGGTLNWKIILLAIDLSISLSVYGYGCICYQHNAKTNCSRSTKFGILQLYHVQMLLETFMKIEWIVCIQGHSKEFENVTAYWWNFFLVHFNVVFKLH